MQIRTRPLEERDLPEADRILRLAFGTFLGLPDPMTVFGDSNFAHTRFRADPASALAAESEGKLVGSNFVTHWGSFGFFGPLSVEPQLWSQGVAQRLLEPTVELFEGWRCRNAGLFTFSHSPKHIALYQKFDFWAGFLTPMMSKPVVLQPAQESYLLFSGLTAGQKEEALAECRRTTGEIYEGLDVSREIRAVDSQGLGDTLLLLDGSKVGSFAVCHVGANTEAGSGICYVKFGAVRPGDSAQIWFERLLSSCEAYAAARNTSRLQAGVNMSRHEPYKIMIGRGFRADMVGVAMQKGKTPGFNRPGVYLLDDWR
ncbi:MAG TPA: GNAT family N-acetyltransferase [Candidatus Binataceae bacterium]|nr:GNAT family N-acetyltransferase [Candidatus Binataceae bacterium]